MDILKKALTIILDIISIILIVSVVTLGVIPNKFLFLILLIVILLAFIFTFLSFKNIGKVKNAILIIFSIIISIVYIVGIYYIKTTDKFFNGIAELNEKSLYYVIVNKESDYYKLTDLIDKKVGVFSNQSDSYVKAIEELSSKVVIDKVTYNSTKDMVNNLYDSSIDSILINSSNYELLCENIEGFSEKVRILDEIYIELQINSLKDLEDPNRPFNLFISGIDVSGDINTSSRSDVNIIATVNPNTHKILLTHIPRDYYVNLHGIENGMDKLTHAGMYGIDMSVQTVEDFMNIDIDYYLRVNFDTLVRVVDVLGGIDVYSDATFSVADTFYFHEGINHMNGKEALVFSRERYSFAEGDRRRGKHQEQVIEAIIKKVSSSSTILTNYSEFLSSLSDSFQTNISENLIKKYIKNQLDGMPNWSIESISVNGEDYAAYNTYSLPDWYMYLVYPDQDTIDFAHDKIEAVLNGD